MKKFCVIKEVKDEIPGFRDKDQYILKCFKTKNEAEEYLKNFESEAIYHPGYGAGDGQISTTYFIKEIEEE